MLTNKIIYIVTVILGIVLLPVQAVSTFVLGLVVWLSFGVLLLPITLIWTVLFYFPLLGLSYLYDRIVFLRFCISIIGIPLTVMAEVFVALMPSMGEMDSRYQKLVLCGTFPYTWRFVQFQKNKIKINENDILHKIIRRVVKGNKALDKYLNGLRVEMYSRPGCNYDKQDLGW